MFTCDHSSRESNDLARSKKAVYYVVSWWVEGITENNKSVRSEKITVKLRLSTLVGMGAAWAGGDHGRFRTRRTLCSSTSSGLCFLLHCLSTELFGTTLPRSCLSNERLQLPSLCIGFFGLCRFEYRPTDHHGLFDTSERAFGDGRDQPWLD